MVKITLYPQVIQVERSTVNLKLFYKLKPGEKLCTARVSSIIKNLT